MSDVIVAPAQRDLDRLGETLADWLAPRLDADGAIEITSLSYPRGAGQSHETILFDACWDECGKRRAQGMVVRIKPTRFIIYPDDLFTEQYEIMRMLGEDGRVRVARTRWIEQDASILGAPFFVMDKAVGRVPVSHPPYAESGWVAEASPAQRRTMWESGVRQLAAIQAIPIDQAPFLAGPPHARDGLEQEFDKFARFVAWVQEDRPWPVLERALDRLREGWPDNQPAGIVWGDARIGNIMFDSDFQAIAVMDWEQPSLGGALNDLGWWLVNAEQMHGRTDRRPHLEGFGTRAETIALWETLTGKSADDVEWYEGFAKLKMSCLNVRMCALRALPPPDEEVIAKRLGLD